MPIIAPLPIHDTGIGAYGNIIGLRKFRYMLGAFEVVSPPPITIVFKEQCLFADSLMFSETPNRAETVIITNV